MQKQRKEYIKYHYKDKFETFLNKKNALQQKKDKSFSIYLHNSKINNRFVSCSNNWFDSQSDNYDTQFSKRREITSDGNVQRVAFLFFFLLLNDVSI